MENRDTGLLLNQNNLKLHRHYFKQMVRLIGINVVIRAPLPGKTYDGYGELDSFFHVPEVVGCIFVEHPNQYTMKKVGWVSELQESESLIQLPYDTKGIERGTLFIVPSGIDGAEGRVFQLEDMSNILITPAYITCKIAPFYKNTFEKNQLDHQDNNFNLLVEEED